MNYTDTDSSYTENNAGQPAAENLPRVPAGVLFTSLLSLTGSAREASVAAEVTGCNADTACYGLTLSPTQAVALARTVSDSLHENGRVEPAGSIMPALIRCFAPSPHISRRNWETELHALCAIFYRFKSEMRDRLDDAELLELMREYYDGDCAGSTELLEARELDAAARRVRAGLPPRTPPEDESDGAESDFDCENDDGRYDDGFTAERYIL